MDPISLVVGAAILALGWTSGWFSRQWIQRRTAPYMCTCPHPFSSHDPKTGECHGYNTVRAYNENGGWSGKEDVPCACRQYVGERPIDITSLGLPGYTLPDSAKGGDNA